MSHLVVRSRLSQFFKQISKDLKVYQVRVSPLFIQKVGEYVEHALDAFLLALAGRYPGDGAEKPRLTIEMVKEAAGDLRKVLGLREALKYGNCADKTCVHIMRPQILPYIVKHGHFTISGCATPVLTALRDDWLQLQLEHILERCVRKGKDMRSKGGRESKAVVIDGTKHHRKTQEAVLQLIQEEKVRIMEAAEAYGADGDHGISDGNFGGEDGDGDADGAERDGSAREDAGGGEDGVEENDGDGDTSPGEGKRDRDDPSANNDSSEADEVAGEGKHDGDGPIIVPIPGDMVAFFRVEGAVHEFWTGKVLSSDEEAQTATVHAYGPTSKKSKPAFPRDYYWAPAWKDLSDGKKFYTWENRIEVDKLIFDVPLRFIVDRFEFVVKETKNKKHKKHFLPESTVRAYDDYDS